MPRPQTLRLEVDLYRSSAGVVRAQQAYSSQEQSVTGNEAPKGITQVTWTTPGLGNWAIGQTWPGAPAADDSMVSVWVQSGNADIYLSNWSPWTRSASDYAQEARVMAMARGVLAALRQSSG